MMNETTCSASGGVRRSNRGVGRIQEGIEGSTIHHEGDGKNKMRDVGSLEHGTLLDNGKIKDSGGYGASTGATLVQLTSDQII